MPLLAIDVCISYMGTVLVSGCVHGVLCLEPRQTHWSVAETVRLGHTTSYNCDVYMLRACNDADYHGLSWNCTRRNPVRVHAQ